MQNHLTSYAELINKLLNTSPTRLGVHADPEALEGNAEHIQKITKAVSSYLDALIKDVSASCTSTVDVKGYAGVIADIGSDLAGELYHAAYQEWGSMKG